MLIDNIRKAIAEVEEEEALDLVKKAMQMELDAKEVLEKGVMTGLKDVGNLYQQGEYFLAELMIGGKLVDACITILEPYLPIGDTYRGHISLFSSLKTENCRI